jgi:hypothetical protein
MSLGRNLASLARTKNIDDVVRQNDDGPEDATQVAGIPFCTPQVPIVPGVSAVLCVAPMMNPAVET